MADDPITPQGAPMVSIEAQAAQALDLGRQGVAKDPTVAEMRLQRKASDARGKGGSITRATMRPKDPMFYWEENNLPYKIDQEEDLVKIRHYARMLYMTHPVIASAIDIYSKYPLTGMELTCKDPALTEFYTDLFFDQLDYEEFLVWVLREYWTVGEAWPLGSFNEVLGVWEDDELMNPDDVKVTKSPFMREPRFEMRLPQTLRGLMERREPAWEYESLMRSYPELRHFTGENAMMPVSNVLLQQLAFKAHTFHPRGIPIIMRGMRAVMQEEMLNAAQDAIADRLYTPLILVRLGASASDLGTSQPWIPTTDDLAEFEQHLDAALAADFRVLTHHFGVQMDSVFGRETMPRFEQDFDRLTERQLQVFGMSKAMLSGSTGGQQTYAAEALNRDLVSQLLSGAQRIVKRFFKQRALVVAEAQEHFDYEVRGGKRYPIMEEVLEVDEETGQERVVEQPALLVPDLQIKAMDVRREEDLRKFVEAARASGVPISDATRMMNVPIDLDAEREALVEEAVQKAIDAQEARKRTYEALKARRLPIPEDLLADFEPKGGKDPSAQPSTAITPASGEPQVLPSVGTEEPAPTDAIVPTTTDLGNQTPGVEAAPSNRLLDQGRTRPPESDEQRGHMPVAAALAGWGEVRPVYVTSDDGSPRALVDEETGKAVIGTLTHGPSHVGMRRFSVVKRDVPLTPDTDSDPGSA